MALQDDAHYVDGLRVRRVDRTPVNPAIEEKQDAAIVELQAILAAVDGLELSVDNIDLDLDATNTLITATNAAIATLRAANDVSGDDVVAAVDAAKVALEASLAALQASNETHSDEEQAAVASLEAAVALFHAHFDARDLATETTLSALNAAFGAEDFASETTLGALKTSVDAALADIDDSIGDTTDLEAAGDGTVIAILKRLRTRLDALISQQAAEDFATEATLTAFKAENATNLNDIEADIEAFKAAFDARDLATETTLAAFKAEAKAESDATQALIGEVSVTPTANTLLDRLKQIYEAVDGLELSLDNIDIDMEVIGETTDVEATGNGTLIAVTKRIRTLSQNIKDFLDAEDFAQEATQVAFKAEAHADSLDEQAAVDELKAQNLAKHDSIIVELQDVEADVEALISSFETRTGEVSLTPTANTVLGRLKDIHDKLIELDGAFDAEDFATEATLSALKAEAHADSLDEQAAVDELKAQNATKHDSIISELQDVEADIEALTAQHLAESNDTQSRIGEVSAIPTANTVMDRLKNIYEAVDGLELSIGNIDIDMDDLEALIAATNAALSSLEAANDISGDDIVTAVALARTTLDATIAALQASNETHSDEVKAAVVSLEAAVAAFQAAFDARDLATETTLAAFKAEAKAESDATQVTLATLLTEATFVAEDFASEATLLALKAATAKRAGQILKHEQASDERLRAKEIISGATTTFYVGVAPIGTAITATGWEMVRRVETIVGTTTDSQVDYLSGVIFNDYATLSWPAVD